jgi:hypothetical protein
MEAGWLQPHADENTRNKHDTNTIRLDAPKARHPNVQIKDAERFSCNSYFHFLFFVAAWCYLSTYPYHIAVSSIPDTHVCKYSTQSYPI